MKKSGTILFLISVLLVNYSYAKEYHVSKSGIDSNDGELSKPFLTISKAVEYAHAGDTITVHEGVYREWINPIRGGNSKQERILFRASPGEKVEIKGSEIISNWERVENGVWKAVIPNTFFQDYNPYQDSINGDWFHNWGRVHHTGEVFLNGQSLYEKEMLDLVLDAQEKTWYCESDEQNTIIWANFHDFDPNEELTEISARRTCFYPSEPGINYITIRGFEISQAATQWAAPTAEQVGMIATHWNKGWIIENNRIHDSKCSGITLGKDKATGHNVWLADPGIDGSVHYIEVIFKVLRNGWDKENIGSHIVRNNEIYHCEQTGICGSFGAAFSIIENNHIHHIWTKRQFGGAEIAGVKIHGGIDLVLNKNRINDCGRGFWLDWMTQGALISQNLMYNNDREDIYFEVNHGPFLVDNNIFLSDVGLVNQSSGGAFVHNLFAGETKVWAEPSRFTPYQLAHSTQVAGVSGIISGDSRFYNNIFVGVGINKGINKTGINTYGLSTFNDSLQLAWGNLNKRKIEAPSFISDNVYLNGAVPYRDEEKYTELPYHNPEIILVKDKGEVSISINIPEQALNPCSQLITTAILGKTRLSGGAFEKTNGSPLRIDSDYFGLTRSVDHVVAGPFSNLKNGYTEIKVW